MSKHYVSLAAGLCLFAVGCGADDEKNAKSTESGIRYIDLTEGNGEPANAGDYVEIHYVAMLRADGSKFESTHDLKQPVVFQLVPGGWIKRWDEGIVGMKAGGKRKLIIASGLAYGESGRGKDVPPNSDIVVEVELVRILTETVQVDAVREGTGEAIKKGNNVEVFYTGRLKSNGQMFDSNVGGNPFTVENVGAANVIKGWNQGLVGMKVGGKYRLTIPAHLGYGARGSGEKIPPNADLEFDIEVVRIK